MSEEKTVKRLSVGIIIIVILAVCLCITTFALVYESVSVKDNAFKTGEVKINLNDGKPVISEHEFVFEPGMTVTKNFFVENNSTCDVYYRLYLDDASGGLCSVLKLTVRDGDRVLYSGSADSFNKQNASVADNALKSGQRRNLTIEFKFPEESGNNTQKLDLTFTMRADATQTKNNPDKLFD